MSGQARTLSIIGSSNSRRIFEKRIPHLTAFAGCDVVVKGATTFRTGELACQALKGNDTAVISFVTNTLVDECGMALADELDAKISEVLVKYVEVLKAIPITVTIIIMYPFPRVQPTWVFDSIGFIHSKLDTLLDDLGPNIHRFPYLAVTKDDFETDFIHLKSSVCDTQYQEFCASFTKIFAAVARDLDEFDMSDSDNMLLPTTSAGSLTGDFVGEAAGAGGSLRTGNQWGNVLPQLTPNSQRVRIPNERRSSLKRPASGESNFNGAKSTRLNNGQSIAQPRIDSQRQGANYRNTNPTNNTGYRNARESNFNADRRDRRVGNQWESNPGTSGAGRNPGGSDQIGQSRGRGGNGGGGLRGYGGGDTYQSGARRSSDGAIEVRLANLEKQGERIRMEMVANYELTETALNKANAASVIIDCLPFGSTNSNDLPVDVVGDLVQSMGGPREHVVQAHFLYGGPAPPRGTFARIRATFSSERSAFDFRTEATAARRRGAMPWGSTYVSNDPTKGTKVRIEILQQLAKAAQGTVEGSDADILVSKFEPRPMLLFKRGGKIYKRSVYSEALVRFGRLVVPQAYELARKIAGREYEGRMDVVFGI